jgi:hypothetical protein
MKRLLSRVQKVHYVHSQPCLRSFLLLYLPFFTRYEKQTRKINDQVIKKYKHTRDTKQYFSFWGYIHHKLHKSIPTYHEKSKHKHKEKRPQVWIHEICRNFMHQQQEFFPANRVKHFIHFDVQIISYLCHVEDKISILNLWPVIQKMENKNLSSATGKKGPKSR